MRKPITLVISMLTVSACSPSEPSKSVDKQQASFDIVVNAGTEQTFVIEKNSGCLWLVTADWTSVKPVPGEKRTSIDSDKNFAKGLDQYALVSVRTAKEDKCEQQFGLGVRPLDEIKSEVAQ